MKNFILSLLLLVVFSTQVFSANINYKNIPNKTKISYNQSTTQWSAKVNKKSDMYFIKTKGFGEYSDYIKPNKDFAFTTNCKYEFINNGKFIGYSDNDYLFYYFDYVNGELVKTQLSEEEVQNLFPDFQIIKLSEFNNETNALKIKKGFGNLKVILYNDKDLNLKNYSLSTGNAEFEPYELNGFLNITKKGMIQFSKSSDDTKNAPWFVLLVR